MNLKKAPATLVILFAVALCLVISASSIQAQPTKATGFDKERGRDMLSIVKSDLKKNYYDPAYHGMDLDERFQTASEKIGTADSNGQIFGIIAQALLDLEDSHTFFLPPGRSARTQYGWEMQMVGNSCLVTAVKPGTDAEAKGLKAGDEILAINNIAPSRQTFWKMQYYFNALRPQPGMKLNLKKPSGKEEELLILAKITPLKRVLDLTEGDIYTLIREDEEAAHFNRQRYAELGDDLLIWKMPSFSFDESDVDAIMGKVRNHKTLILDLRGNPGGYVVTLQRIAGYFFDHDVKIADRKGRKDMKPQLAKTRGDKIFKGQLVVLIDSRSASAAEIFARLVQLEKRGTVLGDQSAGAVMESRVFPHESGLDTVVPWAISITDADVIMTDGKSLEKTGVTADESILPTPADLAAGRDPVMTRAAELAGVKLDPVKAGSLFPIEWRK